MFINPENMTSNLRLDVTVVSGLCDVIDSARSTTVGLLLQYGEYDQLVKLEIDPLHYNEDKRFRDDYLLTKVGSKSPNWPTSFDRTSEAESSFWRAEELCKATNARLIDASNPLPSGVFHGIQIFRNMLGPLSRQLPSIEKSVRFGSGANVGIPAVGSVLSDKFRKNITLTSSLIPFYRSLLGDAWDYCRNPQVVCGNSFATVPKNAKTDRGICKEPMLNSFLQLGIGACLRRRLRHNGCNLNDQSVNQHFASIAEKQGLATIDLSMASDTLSKECVRLFCDTDWFQLLDVARSPSTIIDGRIVPLEKFSSMGNGFTFELETLVFLSVARGVVPKEEWHNVNAYGDDIIVPQAYANEVILCLEFLGFKPNTEKSYLSGLFFESCGKDFFKSQPVRPFFLRGGSTKKGIPYALQIANSLRLYAKQCGGDAYCDVRFRPLWVELYKKIPRKWRMPVTTECGDTGVIMPLEEAKVSRWSKDGWSGYRVHLVYFRPKRIRKNDLAFFYRVLMGFVQPNGQEIDFIDQFHGIPEDLTSPNSDGEPVRGILGTLVRKATFIPHWDDALTWL